MGQSTSTTPSPGYIPGATNTGYPTTGYGVPKSPGTYRNERVLVPSGVGSRSGSRPPSAERTQPSGGTTSAPFSLKPAGSDQRLNHHPGDQTRVAAGHPGVLGALTGVNSHHSGSLGSLPSQGTNYDYGQQQQPPPLPQRNLPRAGSITRDSHPLVNGHGAHVHAHGSSNNAQTHYNGSGRPPGGSGGGDQFSLANKPVSMVTNNVLKRDSSNSPARHGNHGNNNRNSIELTTLRGSNQDVSGKQRLPGATTTRTTNPPSTSTPERINNNNTRPSNGHINHGYSSHGDITQTMAQLGLNSKLNSNRIGSSHHHNPNYSPSEASSSHSVTPPLPPLSPSNTPPMTPPESPRGLPPHLRGNPHHIHNSNQVGQEMIFSIYKLAELLLILFKIRQRLWIWRPQKAYCWAVLHCEY